MDQYSNEQDNTITGEELNGYENSFRQSETPRKKKKRKKKHYFLRFCIFIAVIVLAFLFVRSDFFTVKDIEVSGNEYYTAAQIVELSGLTTGNNLFFDVDKKSAKAALLADPYIKLAEIKKKPRSTVQVNITERIEYACVPYGDTYVLIDCEGTVLRISETEPTLPLLIGMTVSDMTPGKPLVVEETYLLTDTLELLSVMDESDIFFKKINFSTVIVKAYIYDNLYCEGSPANIKNNMKSVQKLLQELYQQNITRGVIRVGTDNYLSYSPDY